MRAKAARFYIQLCTDDWQRARGYVPPFDWPPSTCYRRRRADTSYLRSCASRLITTSVQLLGLTSRYPRTSTYSRVSVTGFPNVPTSKTRISGTNGCELSFSPLVRFAKTREQERVCYFFERVTDINRKTAGRLNADD